MALPWCPQNVAHSFPNRLDRQCLHAGDVSLDRMPLILLEHENLGVSSGAATGHFSFAYRPA